MQLHAFVGGASLPMVQTVATIINSTTLSSHCRLRTDSLITHAIIVQQYLLKPVTSIITLHWATCPDYSQILILTNNYIFVLTDHSRLWSTAILEIKGRNHELHQECKSGKKRWQSNSLLVVCLIGQRHTIIVT